MKASATGSAEEQLRAARGWLPAGRAIEIGKACRGCMHWAGTLTERRALCGLLKIGTHRHAACEEWEQA